MARTPMTPEERRRRDRAVHDANGKHGAMMSVVDGLLADAGRARSISTQLFGPPSPEIAAALEKVSEAVSELRGVQHDAWRAALKAADPEG